MSADQYANRLRAAVGVSGHQLIILQLLTRRREVSREALIDAMYGGRPDGGPDLADEVLSVAVCYLRRKLRPFEVEIASLYGYGYKVSARDQALLRSIAEGGA